MVAHGGTSQLSNSALRFTNLVGCSHHGQQKQDWNFVICVKAATISISGCHAIVNVL
jgi:hypothetical protein